MKIKIGNKIYDPHEEPIMLIFNDEADRNEIITHLSQMDSEARKYCMFDDKKINREDIKKFMKVE